MTKDEILKLREKAIENVSHNRSVKGQVERTWMQDDFDLEFARLILEAAGSCGVTVSTNKYYDDYDGGIMSHHFANNDW